MRIYVAGSWRNEQGCLFLAKTLRGLGHEVDCFCDASSGRHVFSFAELGDPSQVDAFGALESENVRKAFVEDKAWIEWSQAVVLVLPSGRSAHLEAGYAVGKGKRLFILGDFPKGELDVMYGFANRLVRTFDDLAAALSEADGIGPSVVERFNASEVRPGNFEGFAGYRCVRTDIGKTVQALQMNIEEGFYLFSDGVMTTGDRGDWIVFYKDKFWKVVSKRTFPDLFAPLSRGGVPLRIVPGGEVGDV